MQVPINSIIVKKRIRQDFGDLESLAESLKKFGQITPIMITKNNVLIAGERRLEAAKILGWDSIEAVVADISDPIAKLEYEMEENNQRKGFSAQETAEAERKLYQLKNPGFFRKIWNVISTFFKKLFKIKD